MFGILDDPHRRHLLLTLLVAVGLAIYLTGSIESIYGFNLAFLLACVGGFSIFSASVLALFERKITADLAVSLAALAAICVGYWDKDPTMFVVAAEVIFIMLIGEALEHFAIDRTRSGIAALLALRPDEARVRRPHQHEHSHDNEPSHDNEHSHEHDPPEHKHEAAHEHELTVPVGEIRSDDRVLVRPGDRIPVDGRVLVGSSSVDQSPITGESLPADKAPGDDVFAGTINLYGSMELEVLRLGEDTTLEQIIHLVEHAEAAKAPTERLADRYATYFVPIVLVAAGATFLLAWGFGVPAPTAVIRAVSVLVVACPCALVLATPTAVAAGIGALVRRGVLVKGGSVLESLGRLRSVVFDKTGTLTRARLRIAQIVPAPAHQELGNQEPGNQEPGHREDDVLRVAASVERHSEHPVGKQIVERAERQGLALDEATDFVAHPGLGAEGRVREATVRVGSPRYFESVGIELPGPLAEEVARLRGLGNTVVLVARDQEPLGAIAVGDTVRPEAAPTVAALRNLGIERIVMLTGDNEAAAQSVAQTVAIDEVQSELLPADKVEAVGRVQREAAPTAMVGDGINDAPSLVTADVGVAMADVGSDVAIASADVVLVGDDLGKLADAVTCGRAMLRIIRQNILFFALVFNAAAVVAAAFGWITPVLAAVLHQFSSLTVVLNSMRLLIDTRRIRTRFRHLRERWVRRRRGLLAGGMGVVLVAYLLSGFFMVRVGEVGVVRHFGKLVDEAKPPGPHYRLPIPFGKHQRVRIEEVRRVEIGFRTVPGTYEELPAYEWGVQHRGGRSERRDKEATVLAGDENVADVNLVVQYRVADPLAALFRVGRSMDRAGRENSEETASKWDAIVRSVAEAALREVMSQRRIDEVLSSRRSEIEQAIRHEVATTLEAYGTGFAVETVCLADVHPPFEVVPSFRDVASAREEKESKVNEAEAYQYETEALARGEAVEKRLRAKASRTDRTERARGDADRFAAIARAYAGYPEVARLRIYLETVERSLAGREKVILDRPRGGARRQLFLGQGGLWPTPAQPDPEPLDQYPID